MLTIIRRVPRPMMVTFTVGQKGVIYIVRLVGYGDV